MSILIKADFTVDTRKCCPARVLDAKKGFYMIKVGQILEIITTDDDVIHYMPIWADKMGHEFLGMEDCLIYYKVWIRKMR